MQGICQRLQLNIICLAGHCQAGRGDAGGQGPAGEQQQHHSGPQGDGHPLWSSQVPPLLLCLFTTSSVRSTQHDLFLIPQLQRHTVPQASALLA